MATKKHAPNKQLSFMAGAAQVDITPPLGTFINGDFINHYARFIHDSLFAKTLILKNNEILIAIVVVDICEMPTHFVNEIKALIYDKMRIPPSNILISSTHTHAAGSVDGLLLSSVDMAYRQKLPGLILQSVQNSIKNIRSAKIAFGFVDVPEHVRCRRYFMKEGYQAKNPLTEISDTIKTNPFGAEYLIDRPAAQTDPGLSIIGIKDKNDKWICVLGNYSLHYVGDWPNDTISADYFGEFARQLKQKLNAGDDFVGIMSNGTSGDINIWDFMNIGNYPTEYFAKSKFIADDLSSKAIAILKNATWDSHPTLSVNYQILSLNIRKPSAEQLILAIKIVIDTDYITVKTDDDGMRRIYAREQVLLNEYPDTSQIPLQVFKIGDLTIGALPGEFFAETGLHLKKNDPKNKYFTITLANGCEGYIPPKHEIEKGGYETWLARSSFLEADAESKIRNKLIEMIKNY
jgi:neutral ceramidase